MEKYTICKYWTDCEGYPVLTCCHNHRYHDFILINGGKEVTAVKHFGDHIGESATAIAIKTSGNGPLHDLISIAQDFYLSCGVFQKWIESDLVFDY